MLVYPKRYQVLVVGGGHAGIEAALAAARIGCETLLITANIDSIGQMSCNPAIGGLAKGHIVREIDALGGQMAKITDLSGIQFRMLNTGKGPAVQAPRAQCDKKYYQLMMKYVCETTPNLEVTQAEVIALCIEDSFVRGVELSTGIRYDAESVVVTTGTFLDGTMHIGELRTTGGRAGDHSSIKLPEHLRKLGFQLGKMKTGTPPRLLRKTINLKRTQVQNGDIPPPFFSNWIDDMFHMERKDYQQECNSDNLSRFLTNPVLSTIGEQVHCYITYTTDQTAKVIHRNLHRSPVYSSRIRGIGPRYCPSIEDKIVRFKDKREHQVFLEPEGVNTDEIYANGLSTSLPFDVQLELVRTVIGCDEATILRPGYAVEYTFVQPTQLNLSLETKLYKNLFLAGQINGTSGYEEAAAQGIIAGINAARCVLAKPPLLIRRDQAYIGVLIDDLVTKGTNEPYRMFTSRAEFRLLLRQDNADLRLSHLGFEVGLLSKEKHNLVQSKVAAIRAEMARLETTRFGSVTLAEILRRPGMTYYNLPSRDEALSPEIVKHIEIEVKYSGYVARQELEIKKLRTLREMVIPAPVDYEQVQYLSLEAREKLGKIQPRTIGQATRIPGISPADISVLLIWLRRNAQNFSMREAAMGRDGEMTPSSTKLCY